MNDIVVPNHIRLLGREAARLRRLVEVELLQDDDVDESLDLPWADAAGVIVQLIGSNAAAVVRVFNSPGAAKAAGGDGTKGEVYRLAGRLEEVLDRFFQIWHAAQRLAAAPTADGYACDLLTDGVRGVLTQIAQVLDDLATAIDQHDVYDTMDDDTVCRKLSFTLHAPPEFQQLAVWQQSQPGGTNLWSGGVAFALGALLGCSPCNSECD